MIDALLLVKAPGKTHWEGLGLHKFDVPPRVGDHIEHEDDDRIAYLYRVVTVGHPQKPTGVIDIYAVQMGKTVDVMKELFAAS